MRIVYVLNSLGMGGAERQVLALAGRMARRGHTVALLVLRPKLAEEWPTSFDVCRLEMKRNPASLLAGLMKGRRFLLEFHPDLVHSHSFHANIMARLLKVFVPATTVLSTVHNVYEGGWLRMTAYRLTDGLSSRTTLVSEEAARRYLRLKAVPQRKCLVLANGIDAAEFAPDPERRARMRGRWAREACSSGWRLGAWRRPRTTQTCCGLLHGYRQPARRRNCGLPERRPVRSLHESETWRRSWDWVMESAGWGCAAICPPFSTPPTDSF